MAAKAEQSPDFDLEHQALRGEDPDLFASQKPKMVVGIDEAGRGPVLGPLVVAAVAVPADDLQRLIELGVDALDAVDFVAMHFLDGSTENIETVKRYLRNSGYSFPETR